MKASEILRKLADVIDAQTGGEEQSASTEITNRPEQNQLVKPTSTSGIEGQAQVNTRSMVAPLQQKLDIMKRMAGIEGPCTSCGCDPCGCPEPESDELAIMKQNAGIKPVVVAMADEDEPFEG
jgi:hypothetical protein